MLSGISLPGFIRAAVLSRAAARVDGADCNDLQAWQNLGNPLRSSLSGQTQLARLKMVRRSGKKKKARSVQPDGAALGGVFGVKVDFAGEVEANLAGVDLGQVLVEKSGGVARPPTLQEKLATYPLPQEELNLHGYTGDEAFRKTIAFINGSQALRLRTVQIITGKGLHSEGPPVLPLVVDGCLEELKLAGRIAHYSWGAKGRDRSGAVVVFLK